MTEGASMRDYLDVTALRPVPQALISTQDWQKLERLCAKIPALTYGQIFFERALATPDSPVDFSMMIHEGDGVLMCDWLLAESRRRQGADAETWRHLHRWMSTLYSRGDNFPVGLEFDIDDEKGVPGIFSVAPVISSREQWSDCLRDYIELMCPFPLSVPMRRTLQHCVSSLPPEAYFWAFGVMASRPVPALKIGIRQIRSEHVVGYLRSVGWCGDLDLVTDLLQRVACVSTLSQLDLDVADEIAKIGIQFANISNPIDPLAWRNLLNVLVARGLALPDEQLGIEAWTSTIGYSEAVWPTKQRQMIAQQPLRLSVNAFLRTVHNFKISFEFERLPVAKVYLGSTSTWYDRLSGTFSPMPGHHGQAWEDFLPRIRRRAIDARAGKP